MLKKVRNLRAIRPGEWVQTTVPDYECWQQDGDWKEVGPGRVVEACVCPIHVPLPESRNGFCWRYRAAIRRVGYKQPIYCLPGGYHISPWDLGMVEGTSKPFWEVEEYRRFLDGKGVWLYEPASDDPELCPGADCSIYECGRCGEYRMPWSDDDGNLICMYCEATGLVIHPDVVNRLEDVREFARKMGLSQQLERQLCHHLGRGMSFGRRSQCVLMGDFAPHSFSFAHYFLPDGEDGRKLSLNGGLIYSGPGSPGDGSFPSLSVNLSSSNGWFCHT